MMMLLASLLLAAPVFAATVPVSDPHEHPVMTQLGTRWHHESDHPVHALFRRGPTDGVIYAPVGSESKQNHDM